MHHDEAAKSHAVERYLLGEMPASERDDFEEHYFGCVECAEGVRSAAVLIGDMKAALRDVQPAPETSSERRFSWWRMPVLVPTCAAALLAVVVGYQNTVVLPGLEAPRSMSAGLILDGRTRGEVPALRAGDPLRFLAAVEGDTGGRLYVEVASLSGARVRSGEVSAPAANRPLDVYFPGTLAAGKYQLVVRANKDGRELARSVFEVINN